MAPLVSPRRARPSCLPTVARPRPAPPGPCGRCCCPRPPGPSRLASLCPAPARTSAARRSRPSTRTRGTPRSLTGATGRRSKMKATETHRPGPARGPPRSPRLDRRGPLRPHSRVNGSLLRGRLGCRGSTGPVSLGQGVQSLHFQKKLACLTAMGRGGLQRPGSGLQRGPSLPYFQGHMGHLHMETTGAPRPRTLVGPEARQHPNLKNARTPMGRSGSSRTALTRWPALPRSLRGLSKASSWGAGPWHLSSLGAPGGLCCLSSKGPGGGLLPLSSAVRGAHPLAISWAPGGHTPVSLRGPEARPPASCRGPEACSLRSSTSRGSLPRRPHASPTSGRRHPFSLRAPGALHLFPRKMSRPGSTSRARRPP